MRDCHSAATVDMARMSWPNSASATPPGFHNLTQIHSNASEWGARHRRHDAYASASALQDVMHVDDLMGRRT
jgi:hypothetical protein